MKNWLRRLLGNTEAEPVQPPAAVISDSLHGFDSGNTLPPTSEPVPLIRHDINDLFHAWLFDIDKLATNGLNDTEKRFLRALERTAAADDAALAQLVPRVPEVIPTLLQSLRDRNISNTELSARISRDVVLVAEVIRQANGASYRRSSAISSIEQALAVLGQNGLRQLVARVAFKPVINNHAGHFTLAAAPRIWSQSNKCAIACRRFAADKQTDSFESFLAGLVYNVGMIVALRVMDQSHDGRGGVGSAAFCSAFATHAHHLSFRIGRQWDFPPSVVHAVDELEAVDAPASSSVLGQVLYSGDRLSKIRVLADEGRLTQEEAWMAAEMIADGASDWLQSAETTDSEA